ncbi:MAG: TRAP transporter permease [Magnetococcales bacterium]|nr:TRAP transporter permease [Magnetococcales bacterium]
MNTENFSPAAIEADLADLERGTRRPTGKSGYFLTLLALAWSLFQLWVVREPIDDTLVRSVHLAFALTLTFLAYPARKCSSHQIIPWSDYLLALLAGLGALYLFLDYDGIAERPGMPLPRDIIIGSCTIILLLEGTRRAMGWPMVILSGLFLGYCHFGPYMPELIAHHGASVRKIVNHMVLTTEGVFGVPLRVSASFVFLFVLFGALLERAGAGNYFIQLAYATLGTFRGGPGKAAVASSAMTGMISGSSIANVVTTGTFTIPLMKQMGFSAEKAAAVETAASVNGQLMPPIMGAAAFIIAEFLGISYTEVVKAAFIPATVSYLGLFYVVHLESCKLGLTGTPRSELPPILATFLSGIHHMIPVGVLVYGLMVEQISAGLAAFNAIFVLIFILLLQKPVLALLHRTPLLPAFQAGGRDLWQGLADGAYYMIPIAVATATAGLVVGTITLTGLGQRVVEVIEVISMGHIFPILLFTAVTSIILGMGLPTTATYIVMASLTAPIIVELGSSSGYIIPALAAHLFVFYFGIIADNTPPVGLASYAAAAIAHSDPVKTGVQAFAYDMRTAVLPFLFIFNTDLILIQGIVPGGSPADPAAWIWVEGWLPILALFGLATLAMFAFVSAVMGWNAGFAPWWERLLLLVVCVGLFRPGILSGLFSMEKTYWMVLPPLLLYAVLAGRKMPFLGGKPRLQS